MSNPLTIYSVGFDEFCANIDPLAPLALIQGTIASSSKGEAKDAAILRAGCHIMAEGTGMEKLKYVYWGEEKELIVPIIIDTGASISVTGVKTDFIGPI